MWEQEKCESKKKENRFLSHLEPYQRPILGFFRIYQRVILRLVWLATVVSLAGLLLSARKTEGPVWLTPGVFWDVSIYHRALQAVRAGLDPYAVGLARQYAAQAAGKHAFTYVYPPLTLLALRAINLVPVWLAALLYWTAYSAGYGAMLWAVTQCFRPQDRAVMQYAVPLVIFFPGLMTGDTILSGNIAYIFYGLLFASAAVGWKRGIWRWFYLATLLAACFKLPFLTLLAIPVLAGERQWLKATGVGAAGVSLWALQSWLWPVQFHEYMVSVGLQFQFNHDFGESPAGNLGRALYWHGLPYTSLPMVVFLIYGSVLFAALYYFSRLYHQDRISAESWIPVLLVGTILLNPRIMQYDLHAISLPMTLILARSAASRSKVGIATAASVVLLIVIDLFGVNFYDGDNLRNMLILLAVMALGLHYLAIEASDARGESLFVLPVTVPSEASVEKIIHHEGPRRSFV